MFASAVIEAQVNYPLKKVLFCLPIVLMIMSCSKDSDFVDFQILSLNTFLLDTPDITIGPSCESDCVARAEDICEVLSTKFDDLPDVLLFQEVFEQDACESLTACLRSMGYSGFSPCLESDPNWENRCLIKSTKSSGLFIASKFQISDYEFESFEDCNGCLLWGSDCQANKGFQYFKVQIDARCSVSIINTHLDAGGGPEDVETRSNQSSQILAHLDQQGISESATVIIAGDLNTETTIELQNFTSSLDIQSLNTTEPTSDSGKVLDHILVSSTSIGDNTEALLATTCEEECEAWFDSDHIALLAKLSVICQN